MNVEQERQVEPPKQEKPSVEEIRNVFEDSTRKLREAQERTRKEHPFTPGKEMGEFVDF